MINLSSNETFNIVTIGAWNPAIFSPEWAKKNLASDPSKDVILAIPMQMTLPARLTVDDVNIYPSTTALMIDCVEYSPQSKASCSDKLAKIASLLEHTPVNGVGVNFRFAIEIGESPELMDLFSLNDASKIKADEFRITSSSIKRSFILQDSTSLNLSIESIADKFICEFNFHSDISCLPQIKEMTSSEKIDNNHKKAVEFMQTVYSIEIE